MSASVETFKLQVLRLQEAVSSKCIPNSLCPSCRPVEERISHIFARHDDEEFTAGSRDAEGTLTIGAVAHILSESNDCPFCSLAAQAIVRAHQQAIHKEFVKRKRKGRAPTLDTTLVSEILSSVMEQRRESIEEDTLVLWQEVDVDNLRVNVDSLPTKGSISVWMPRSLTDELNDEESEIFMDRADFEKVFGKPVDERHYVPKPFEGSTRDLERFRACFESCRRNHHQCQKHDGSENGEEESSGMPSRLLDIEEMKVVSTGTETEYNYIALSYVWGRQPFLTLLESNWSILSRPNGLQVGKRDENQDKEQAGSSLLPLPRTILDAIDISRVLGLRYLWVDSLCIMQDRLSDKMDEIRRMHLIYSNACLSIVAATGDSAQAPLLPIDPGFLTDSYVEVYEGKAFTLDRPEFSPVVEFSTWFSRGWTLQELLCSKRALYFTPERTYYSCESGNWSEDFQFPLPIAEDSIEPKPELTYTELPHVLSPDDGPKTGFFLGNPARSFSDYTLLVEKMSERAFTRDEDVLNASLGIYTTYLFSHLGTSVAGLPAKFLEAALMWQPLGRVKRRDLDPFGMPFPTWSWCGWVGRMHYPFFETVDLEVKTLREWTILAPREGSREALQNVDGGAVLMEVVRPACPGNVSFGTAAACSIWVERKMPEMNLEWKRSSADQRIRVSVSKDGASPPQGKNMTSFPTMISSAILTTTASTAHFPLAGAEAPELPGRNGLYFFLALSPDDPESIVGEIKVDGGTLAHYFFNPDDQQRPDSAELLAFASLDFKSEGFEGGIMYLNQYSRLGQFSAAFTESLDTMEDEEKDMAIVLWIVRRGGVAYRVGMGYVSLNEYQRHMGPEELIFMG
ncbi:hypothetical protein MKZ38_004217 [Zalerion maritima]|uniref:Heterokaryon incompatibility domain-containing protein n=1 Tax=Zalerion maritima TaxID=339359 RepID=A0AAD5RLW1_9PEZI|nr:hypothetical protein MKZ38_004217 [Zalerion maritima]